MNPATVTESPGAAAEMRVIPPAPPRRTEKSVRVQINIFALNEGPTIGRVVRGVPAQLDGVESVRVVVIDDGSTDATVAEAQAAGASVISHGTRRGLGAVFRSALTDALANDADVMVTIDGDGQFDPAQIPQLVAPLLTNQADMATCSRFLDPALLPEMPAVKRWGNHTVAGLVSRLSGRQLRDVSCGFRAYSHDALIRLNLMGAFTYTHETILELAFKGMRIVEVPLAVRGVREFGRSRVASNVLNYGVRTLQILFGTLLNHRPHLVFATLAGVSATLGAVLAIVGLIPFILTGSFLKWAMFTGAFFVAVAILLLLFGLQARALYRAQFLLENILYEQRRRDRVQRRGA